MFEAIKYSPNMRDIRNTMNKKKKRKEKSQQTDAISESEKNQ